MLTGNSRLSFIFKITMSFILIKKVLQNGSILFYLCKITRNEFYFSLLYVVAVGVSGLVLPITSILSG